MLVATLILTAAQTLGAAPGQPDRGRADLLLRPGAIEAPTQPTGRSTSDVVRTPRLTPEPAPGATGPIRVRVRDLARVRGQEDNVVQGIGLVTGLAGTGDTSPAARQSLLNALRTQNINLTLQDVNSSNVAVCLVQATLPPSIKPGSKIDVRVASIYDCESLVGGTLLAAELTDMTGADVYVTASGPITTGAFAASGEGASIQRNHPTVGTIPGGGKVQREVATHLVSQGGFIYLDMHALKGSFANVVKIADAINEVYSGAAVALDAMTVSVEVPEDLPETAHVAYLSSVLEREVEPASFARVQERSSGVNPSSVTR